MLSILRLNLFIEPYTTIGTCHIYFWKFSYICINNEIKVFTTVLSIYFTKVWNYLFMIFLSLSFQVAWGSYVCTLLI